MHSSPLRGHPSIQIPAGARNPDIPSPVSSWSPYLFEVEPPDSDPYSAWDDGDEPSYYYAASSSRSGAALDPGPSRSSSRLGRATRSMFATPSSASLNFPPSSSHLARSISQRSALSADTRSHRPSKSDVGQTPLMHSRTGSFASLSEFSAEVQAIQEEPTKLSDEQLQSNEGLDAFQKGRLPEEDDAWHRLVPETAREALGKQEVLRQSRIFDILKLERDYVRDLEFIKECYIDALRFSDPPVIKKDRLRGFIKEVFWNLDDILAYHKRMLGALFARQREQHPVVHSLSDILLETALTFGEAYESYYKHYPLAKARHISEVNRNGDYAYFMRQRQSEPRMRKRDFTTLLFRPPTRLTSLKLQISDLEKVTRTLYGSDEHPDATSLDLVQDVINGIVNISQPGIDVADSKAKFWDLCESLLYQKGEIIDMDLYDEARTLVYSGPLARRQRRDLDFHGWHDLHVALLDNHLLLTKEQSHASGMLRRAVVSRPIPLEYLRLGSFVDPPESRKIRDPERSSFRLLGESRPMYPFTVFHAASKSHRRYTLYASKEEERTRWKKQLTHALAVRASYNDSNKWFAPQVVNDGFFRGSGGKAMATSGKVSGKITTAAVFTNSGRQFIVVSTSSAIYAAPRGEPTFQKVLPMIAATYMVALQEFNRLIVQQNGSLVSYALDAIAGAALGLADAGTIRETAYTIHSTQNGTCCFFRAGKVGHRMLVMYSARTLMQVTLHALELVNTSSSAGRSSSGAPFRSFGEPMTLPKDVHDLTPLVKTVAVCGERGMLIVDPTNLSKSIMTVVPDFRAASQSPPMQALKERCDAAKVLGIVRVDSAELLVLYDDIGCYVTKHGAPSRSCGYIRWESRAVSFTHRGQHVLLISPEFIEVRNVTTGRLVQVIEGADIRLLHSGTSEADPLLVGMTGRRNDDAGISESIVELVQTSELGPTPLTADSGAWDDWDLLDE